MVGEKTYKNKKCLSGHFTSYSFIILMLKSMIFELSTILMIRGCTSLANPQIINNLETVGRRKNLYKQKCLSKRFTSYSLIIIMLRSTIFELSTILMIRGCTSSAHPKIIKFIYNLETVGRKKLIKTKKCLSQRFTSYSLIIFLL